MAELLNKNFISIHYGEIALKGGNRSNFEKLLIKNIQRETGVKPIRLDGRLIIESDNGDIKDLLRLTPGVEWIGDSTAIERDLDLLKKKVDEIRGDSDVKIDVKRIDKNYEKDSLWIYEFLSKGRKKGNRKMRIEVFKDYFLISFNIQDCIGGLPIGSAGKVLSLFSGGIDSSAVPFELMKRGCIVDLVHVFAMPRADEVPKSKVGEIMKAISKINRVRIYAIPFSIFAIETAGVGGGYDLILFKRFLLMLAEKIAVKQNYKAIATGDSLSQVASQTLDNINAISPGINLPVLRPFITSNKIDIINKAKFYGTYEESIKEYRDCCSIVSKNPTTRAHRDKLEEIEKKVDINSIVDKSVREMRVFTLSMDSPEFIESKIVV